MANEVRAKWEMSLRSFLKLLTALVLILVVIVVVLMVQVGYRNSTVSKVRKSVDSMKVIVDDFKTRADKADANTALSSEAIVAHLQQSIDNGKTLQEIKIELQDLVNQLKG